MPMKLNLGLSRKIGEANYGSRGASLYLEVELDSALLAEPVQLHERVRQLYSWVRRSVTEELQGNGQTHPAPSLNGSAPVHGTGTSHGNGSAPEPASERPRPVTAAQIRAITAIAHRQKIELGSYLKDRVGVDSVDELSIKEASQIIDEMKTGVLADA
jgi:hypothetical protein